MRLAIDIGNTAVKWAAFEGGELLKSGTARGPGEFAEWTGYTEMLACASGDTSQLPPSIPLLTPQTPLPIRLDYKTPQTLGADRVADACGAWALHRGEDCLVVDAGTCITVDLLTADGTYRGGAIMPGLGMNLQALHTFTAKLPLISLEGVEKAPVPGRTTEESIVAGTLGATLLALAGYVTLYRQRCPRLRVLLTGGDAARLSAAGSAGWELQPQLTLIGLNEIMIYNEAEKTNEK